MDSQELTLEVVEAKLKTCVSNFNASEKKEKTKTDFIEFYYQQAFKQLIDGLDHIDSAKRAQARLAELPGLIEAKNKEIEALSFTANPEYHKKENRDKVKDLTKELETLEAEVKQYPEDVKFRLTQADVCFKNYDYNIERVELVKKLE